MRWIALALSAGLGSAAAAPPVLAPPTSKPVADGAAAPLPLWELGLFGGTGSQQAYPGSKEQVRPAIVLPYVIYRGPLLRAERGSVGIRAFRNERIELDIGAAAAFGSSAGSDSVRRGMRDIGTLVEFGPRLRVDLGPAPVGGRWTAELPLRGVFDLSDGMASRGLSFEPRLGWGRSDGSWSGGVSVSTVFGNRRLAETFYGVGPADATATRPAYAARAGLVTWRLAGSLSKSLSRDWRVFAYARVDSVAGAANRASPLIETTSGTSVGVGLAWTLMRSSRTAVD